VAYPDACHALRVQRLHAEPRRVLGRIPGLRILEIPGGDRCCGAAGLYNVTEPEMAGRLMREKAEAVTTEPYTASDIAATDAQYARRVHRAAGRRLWEDVESPDGNVFGPGVVSNCFHLVEHPDLVAQRIARFASVVGRERVIAGTDCGFGTSGAGDEVHPDVAWAKLAALVEGARIASRRMWTA